MGRGHQQREANYKGFEKNEVVRRVLSGFSLTLRPRKIQTFFNNRCLIPASVYNLNHVSVKQLIWPSLPKPYCLIMILFSTISAFYSIRTNFRKWFNCLTKHEATFSSLNISRRTYCSSYDEHACDTKFLS